MKISTISVLALVLLVLASSSDARGGGRGGGSRGGSRSSGGRSSSLRSGGGSFVRSRFSSSLKALAISRGLFFASNRYRGRTRTSDSNFDPIFCFNIKDAVPAGSEVSNSSSVVNWLYRNETVLGIFVCPLGDDSSETYCCGSEEEQYCCTFWQDVSRVIGVVITVLAVIIGLAFSAFFLIMRCKG